jgi:hypothetical protein
MVVRMGVHELLLKLLGDAEFKRQITTQIIVNYRALVMADLRNRRGRGGGGPLMPTLAVLTIQLFTVPSLTLAAVKDDKLVDVLLDTLTAKLQVRVRCQSVHHAR